MVLHEIKIRAREQDAPTALSLTKIITIDHHYNAPPPIIQHISGQ
ncbi:hypothetical protein [Okeania sp. KiyG1]|nr:hypothetical protein [Okeania sp. KiyG1]